MDEYALSDTSKKIMQDFFNSKDIPIKKSTEKSYLKEIVSFSNYIKKDFLLSDRLDCEKYVKYLYNKYSTSTVNKKLNILSSTFNYISHNKKKYNISIFKNYFSSIEKPQISRHLEISKILTLSETDLFLKRLKEEQLRDRLIFYLICTSALSATDISQLRWDQFIEDASGNVAIEYLLKGGLKRYVLINPTVWSMLLKYKTKCISKDSIYDHVFYSQKSPYICTNQIRLIFKRICKDAKIKRNVSISNLQNTFVVYCLKNKMSKDSLMHQQGYSDLRPTRKFDKIIEYLYDETANYIILK